MCQCVCGAEFYLVFRICKVKLSLFKTVQIVIQIIYDMHISLCDAGYASVRVHLCVRVRLHVSIDCRLMDSGLVFWFGFKSSTLLCSEIKSNNLCN